MMNIIEIILIIANAAVFEEFVSVKGLPAVAIGLILEIAAMWIASRLSRRRLHAGWMTLAATAGMIAGTVRYSAQISPLAVAALILTAIVHGGVVLILSELFSNQH